MSHVFISYAEEDTHFAIFLQKELEKRMHKVWLDSNIRGSMQWSQEIDDAIYGAYVILVVVSRWSEKSLYVTYEWSFALGISTPVIPLILEGEIAHPRLQMNQALDFSATREPRWEELIDELDARIDEIPHSAVKSFNGFRNSLHKRGRALMYTGRKTFYRYISGLTHHELGFRLHDEDWALECNTAFWEWLAWHQKKCKDELTLQAFVTHTASPEIWLSDSAADSLSKQAEFVSNGGKIVRVFIGPLVELTGGSAKYLEAMIRMQNIGVHAFYVDKPADHNANDDYTWIPELGILQTWTSRTTFGEHIHEVDFSETDTTLRSKQIRYWGKLKARARDINGALLSGCGYSIPDDIS